MSKQLSLSATIAVLSMAFVALASTWSDTSKASDAYAAAAPFVEFKVSR